MVELKIRSRRSSSTKKLLRVNTSKKYRNRLDTYTEPIDLAVQEILNGNGFDFERFLSEKWDIMKDLLLRYPDTIGAYYNKLVVQEKKILIRDFWMRYFCKCDPKTIESFLSSSSPLSTKGGSFMKKSSFSLRGKKSLFRKSGSSSFRGDDDSSQLSFTPSNYSSSSFSVSSFTSLVSGRRNSSSSIGSNIVNKTKKKNRIKSLFKKKSSSSSTLIPFEDDDGNGDYNKNEDRRHQSSKYSSNTFNGPGLIVVPERSISNNAGVNIVFDTDEGTEDATTLKESDGEVEKEEVEDVKSDKELKVQQSISVARMQSCCKMFLAVKQYERMNRSIHLIQCNMRMYQKVREYQTVLKSGRNLQRYYRGYQARAYIAQFRHNVKLLAEEIHMTRSVQVIQRSTRKYQAARKYQMILKSVQNLQKYYRGYQARVHMAQLCHNAELLIALEEEINMMLAFSS